jgi:hypothetical protein
MASYFSPLTSGKNVDETPSPFWGEGWREGGNLVFDCPSSEEKILIG